MGINRLIRRITGAALAVCVMAGMGTSTAYARPDWPSDTGIMADAGIVIDVDTRAVLFGQQIHVALPPASITKLLTALVVAEHASMDDIVEFSHDAVYNVEEASGNKLSLEEGDKLTVEDCLYVMLLLSSNQAANALAEHVAGSRAAFVEMMNEKTAALGCVDSHFANPSGLNDEQQYVSAYDMALISAAAFENEKVLEVSSAKSHRIPATANNPEGISFNMEHRILMADDTSSDYYCEGATAGKTGYTSIAGNTLVTYAVRDGRGEISVILKGTQPQYYMDAKELLNFGFASFKNVNIAQGETLLTENEQLEIGGVSYPASDLFLDEQAAVTLPKNAEFADADRTIETELSEDAPAGAVALVQYTYNTRKIGRAYLYSESMREAAAAQAMAAEGNQEASGENGEAGPSLPEEGQGTSGFSSGDGKNGSDKMAGSGDAKTGSAGAFGGVWLAVPAAVIFAVFLGIFLLQKKQKREREEAERRKARRRQRLQEIGCSEEEFEKLLKNRQETGAKGKKGENGS